MSLYFALFVFIAGMSYLCCDMRVFNAFVSPIETRENYWQGIVYTQNLQGGGFCTMNF